MEEQNQQLLVSNGSVGCEDHAKPRCCNAQGTVAGMVDSTHSPRRGSCGCGQPRAPFTKFRQISVTSGDSGIGMSLDPISESCYTEENELDNTGEKCMRWTRANLSRETQNCGEHNCGLANNSLQNSETRLVFKGLQCERDQTNPKEIVSGDSRLVDAFALRKSCMIGNRRVRTLSEGCAGYNCVHAIGETISTGDMRLQISQQESPQSKISPNEQSHPADFKNSENYKGINRRQYKSLRRIAVLAVIVALFSAGAAIFVYTNHDAQLDEMKNKVTLQSCLSLISNVNIDNAHNCFGDLSKNSSMKPKSSSYYFDNCYVTIECLHLLLPSGEAYVDICSCKAEPISLKSKKEKQKFLERGFPKRPKRTLITV